MPQQTAPFCSQCGTRGANDQYCIQCGQPLPATGDTVVLRAAPAAAPRFRRWRIGLSVVLGLGILRLLTGVGDPGLAVSSLVGVGILLSGLISVWVWWVWPLAFALVIPGGLLLGGHVVPSLSVGWLACALLVVSAAETIRFLQDEAHHVPLGLRVVLGTGFLAWIGTTVLLIQPLISFVFG